MTFMEQGRDGVRHQKSLKFYGMQNRQKFLIVMVVLN